MAGSASKTCGNRPAVESLMKVEHTQLARGDAASGQRSLRCVPRAIRAAIGVAPS